MIPGFSVPFRILLYIMLINITFMCFACHRITGTGKTSTKCKPATNIYQFICTAKYVTTRLRLPIKGF